MKEHKKKHKKGHTQRQRGRGQASNQSASSQSSSSGFVYPYNFVPVGDVLKRDSFKPLHRYDGLTGRIHYKLKTLSPLFIPDPEGTTIYQLDKNDHDKIHKVMDFFNVNGRLCLPPTSVKGMVRNVVEAATNSSFGVFDAEKKPFTYRKDRGNRRIGKWTTDGRIKPYGVAKLPLKALKKAVRRIKGMSSINEEDLKKYDRQVIRNIQLWKLHTGMPIIKSFKIDTHCIDAISLIKDSGSYVQGKMCKRISIDKNGKIKIVHNKRRIVTEEYYLPWDDDIKKVLKTNGDNIDVRFKWADFKGPSSKGNKKRVYEIEFNGITWKAEDYQPNNIPEGEILFHCKFPEDGSNWSKDYVRVIFELSDQEIDVSDEVKKAFKIANESAEGPIKPCWQGKDLPRPDEIVYYELDNTGNITEFGPVAMFKSAENASLCELVESTTPSVIYPTSAAKLCPATRLFGWTPEDETSGEQGIAGRVRFSTLWSNKTLSDTFLVPLKILGGSKPKYYPFYLKAKDGSGKAGYYTLTPDSSWSQKEGVIRGRKFYLHHPEITGKNNASKEIQYIHINDQNYSSDHKKAPTWPHTNQNSSCRVLPSGAEFTGTIEFESLDKHELGMLLWCLTLSDNPFQSSQEYAHKMGMGKGIGMGSVRIEIDGVCIENPEKNWFELNPTDINPEYIDSNSLEVDKLKNHVMAFKRWLLDLESSVNDAAVNSEFQNKGFITDLLRILKLNLVNINTPIRYYSNHADKGFEYFMDQRKKRIKNEEETLKTPSEIESGQKQHG